MHRKILVVDDIAINRAILREILEKEGYEIVEASDGESALNKLRAGTGFSAILLDIVMPGMDGYEMLSVMQDDENLKQIPVIAVTADNNSEVEVKALRAGAGDFVSKPFSSEIVKQRLWNIINIRETAALANFAMRDRLTGLFNRETFFEKAVEMIRAHEPSHYIMASYDISGFKVINDQYGLEKGDWVLKFVANVFEEGFSELGDAICGRISADNFAVLYAKESVNSEQLKAIRHAASVLDGSIQPITAHVGRYIVDEPTLSASAMYDRACLAGKSIKGRIDLDVAYYDELMREQILREQEILDNMVHALADGQFKVWFQPQYDHSCGALIGAEALVRWQHPQRGLLMPSEFIPVFERSGFIYELDKNVWEQVCILLRRWLDLGFEVLPVSVNVSRYDMFQADFLSVISGLPEKYHLPLDLLRLEITESAFAESTKHIVNMTKSLIERGFIVEIDDFGSGYSSLNTLKEVPAKILKLDMRFLREDSSSQRGGSIIESIIRMAKWLSMPVIAEGVETLEQADFLKSVGCPYIQGYLYAKPISTEEYEELIEQVESETAKQMLQTVESLDNKNFWEPASMDSLIFNSYVGGACVFEYWDGRIEVVRATDKFIQTLDSMTMDLRDAMRLEWARYLSDESLAAMKAAILESATTHEEVVGEYLFLNLPGCYKETYIRMTTRVIASVVDRHLVYCMNQNITSQRKAEKEASQLTERLWAVIENISSGVAAIVTDKNRPKLLFSNSLYYEMHGYTKQQFHVEVTELIDVVHPEDRETVYSQFEMVHWTGGPEVFDLRIVKRDGEVAWLHCSLSLMSSLANESPVFLCVFTNMASDQLVEMNGRNLLKNLPCGAGIYEYVNGEFSITYLNEPYRKMTGRTLDHPDETLSLELVHPDDREGLIKTLQRTIDEKTIGMYDVRIMGVDGEYHMLHAVGNVISSSATKATIYVIFNPVSQKERTYQEMLPVALNAVMESSSDFAFVKDRNLVYLCGTTAFAHLVGCKDARELIGKTDYDLFGEELAERYRRDDFKLMESGESLVDYIEEIPSETGEPSFSSTSKYLLYDSSGSIIGLYGVGRDVTMQMRTKERFQVTQEEYRIVIENSGRMIYRYLHDSGAVELSEKTAQLFRLPALVQNAPESVIETGVISPESIETFRDFFASMKRGDEQGSAVVRRSIAGADLRWLDMHFSTIFSEAHRPITSVIITQDVTEEHERAIAYERYRQTIEGNLSSQTLAFFDTDLTSNVVENQGINIPSADFPQCGCSHEEAVKYCVALLIPQELHTQVLEFFSRDRLLKAFEEGKRYFTDEVPAMLPDNPEHRHWFRVEIQLIGDPFSRHVRALTTLKDITAEKDAILDIRKQAELDGMTGLYNKTTAENLIGGRLTGREGRSCALLIADIDDLKLINDTLGHQRGDEAIKLFAGVLQKQFRQSDILGRVGGDEFAVYLEGVKDEASVYQMMEKLAKQIEEIPFENEMGVELRGSVGAALGLTGRDSYEYLFRQADNALYQAKSEGKNRFVLLTC